MDGLNRLFRTGKTVLLIATAVCAAIGTVGTLLAAKDPNGRVLPSHTQGSVRTAAVITCHGMIDEGLYKSILRRSEAAIEAGADTLIYDIQTYGGLVNSADDISKFLIHEVAPKAHTVAFVTKEAISAGAMVSVSCNDIIMRTSTTIGCSAPIVMGGKLEGVEREKAESFVRAVFSRAAEANGYPEALLKAMVTQQIEVWQVTNKATGKAEFFESEYLPTDPNTYDLADKKLVVKDDEILTLTDSKAYEYGIARAVVSDLDGALAFLAKRDGVTFAPDVLKFETLWSEELVRWLNSPAVVSVLVLGILLGAYVELNTPGLGLPGLLAVTCLVILVGSRYLTGMANWIEIALLIVGILLLLVEIFIIPGFGLAGFLGITFVLVGLFGMFVRTAPGELPWPKDPIAWQEMVDGLTGAAVGFAVFVVAAFLLTRYMDKIPFLRSFVLMANVDRPDIPRDTTDHCKTVLTTTFTVGQNGVSLTMLRPAGKARFGDGIADVVTQGEFVSKNTPVTILEIQGNRIVVSAASERT